MDNERGKKMETQRGVVCADDGVGQVSWRRDYKIIMNFALLRAVR